MTKEQDRPKLELEDADDTAAHRVKRGMEDAEVEGHDADDDTAGHPFRRR